MSRAIKNPDHYLERNEHRLNNTSQGKVIFTKIRNVPCGVLLKDNSLISAAFLDNAPKISGGIYIARIKDVVKEIHAYFVEIAKDVVCFLPMSDAKHFVSLSGNPAELHQGDFLLVQGVREAQKTKSATVSAHISISNTYFAISFGSRYTGYSSKISRSKKDLIRDSLSTNPLLDGNGNLKSFHELYPNDFNNIPLPEIGIVVRTAAENAKISTLESALSDLVNDFYCLLKSSLHKTVFSCIQRPKKSWEEILNTLGYSSEFSEILTDDNHLFQELEEAQQIHNAFPSLRYYNDPSFPLEKLYSLSTKLDEALKPRIWLKSGAYLIIEPTEALTVIDVNSGKYEASKDKEQYYLHINLEAATEISHQLRLRNISGIVVVDFIDMKSSDNQNTLLKHMKDEVLSDPISVNVIEITKLGLMEITRKKNLPTLLEQAKKAGYPIS